MSGSRILFPQFRDEQSDSKYPFTDDATLTADDGLTHIGKDWLLDAVFYPIGGGAAVYISEVVVTETMFQVTVTTTDPEVTAVAKYDWADFPTDGVLALFDAYGRPAGLLLADPDKADKPSKFKAMQGWNPATYTFTQAATEFVSTLFIPAKEPGVRAIKTEQKDFLTGDVWLIGDAGVVLRAEGERVIRVDIVGDPLFKRYACADADRVFPPKRFLKTINGCPPDEYGNFTITATDKLLPDGANDTVLRIYPTLAGIVVEAVGGGIN